MTWVQDLEQKLEELCFTVLPDLRPLGEAKKRRKSQAPFYFRTAKIGKICRNFKKMFRPMRCTPPRTILIGPATRNPGHASYNGCFMKPLVVSKLQEHKIWLSWDALRCLEMPWDAEIDVAAGDRCFMMFLKFARCDPLPSATWFFMCCRSIDPRGSPLRSSEASRDYDSGSDHDHWGEDHHWGEGWSNENIWP